MLDIVTSLVEKSLVDVEEGDDGARYRLLETIRDYAREKLVLRDEQIATGAAHCDYFFVMAKAANRGSQGAGAGGVDAPRGGRARQHCARPSRTALEGGVDPIIAVKFAVALMGSGSCAATRPRAASTCGRRSALPAVQASDVIAWARAVRRRCAGRQPERLRRGAADARGAASRSAASDGKQVEIAATLSTLSLVLLAWATPRARVKQAKARRCEIFAQLGDRIGEAIARFQLGQIHAYIGDDAFAARAVQAMPRRSRASSSITRSKANAS